MYAFNLDQSQLHVPTISCSNTTVKVSGAEMNSDRQQPTRATYTGTATKRGDETMLSVLVL